MGLELKLPSLVGTPEIRFLAVVEDTATRDTASRPVTELGWHQAKIIEGGLDKAATATDPAAPANLLLLDIGGSTDPFAGLDKLAEHCPPETKVLAVGTANDVTLYRRLLSLGIGDYLLKPVTAPMLRDALLHVARPSPSKELIPAAPAKSARLFALIGARGGVGTGMLATAIGWCLAEERARKVALLDLEIGRASCR